MQSRSNARGFLLLAVVGLLLALLGLVAGPACDRALTAEEAIDLAAMALAPGDAPPSPTNRYADDPAAAALGRLLFFDERMSADGQVSCATCHDIDEGMSDPRPLSLGVADRQGDRHSMPIVAIGFQRFLFWDGRADSAWSQPLQAIESEKEMDFTRAEVAHFIARAHRDRYEAVFGPLPDLADVPARARPGLSAWEQIDPARRDAIDRVFAGVGKALEAYQRLLLCADTRFDRWARAELDLDDAERSGAASFIRGGCIRCHSGPAFSDGEFHNVGIGSGSDVPDRGRAAALETLAASTFGAAGRHSDDPATGRALLDTAAAEVATEGAFRTPTLRGAIQRRSFGHRGHVEELGDFIDDVYDGPHMQASAVGELDPELDGVDADDDADLIAFLRTLECPPLPPDLGPPTSPEEE
jgi:cytochrome c peroxidase